MAPLRTHRLSDVFHDPRHVVCLFTCMHRPVSFAGAERPVGAHSRGNPWIPENLLHHFGWLLRIYPRYRAIYVRHRSIDQVVDHLVGRAEMGRWRLFSLVGHTGLAISTD